MYANFIGNAQSENVIFTFDYENELDEISRDTLFLKITKKYTNINLMGT